MFTSIVNEITRKTDRTESCNIRIIAFTAAVPFQLKIIVPILTHAYLK